MQGNAKTQPLYVGMDVHKESVSIAVLADRGLRPTVAVRNESKPSDEITVMRRLYRPANPRMITVAISCSLPASWPRRR